MSTRRETYTARHGRRNSALPLVAALAGTLASAGCAGTGLSDFASETSTTDFGQVSRSDWDAVRRTLADTPPQTATRRHWSNPRTGSSGHVTVLAVSADAACRPFAASINDKRGIRNYRGDACQRRDGNIELLAISADDAQLL